MGVNAAHAGAFRVCAASASMIPHPRGNWAVHQDGGVPCASSAISTTSLAFDITSKRRKSYPSETRVKRGRRFVHGNVELAEKLGRNDLCPCGSGRRFQGLLPAVGPPRRREPG
jgi:hypothetical protein